MSNSHRHLHSISDGARVFPLGFETRRRGVARIRAIVVVGTLFVTGVSIVVFSGLFRIREVAISGIEGEEHARFSTALNGILDEKRKGLFPQRNSLIVFLTGDNIQRRLLAAFPTIATVTITSRFPHSAAVRVEKRETVGVWCRGSGTAEETGECFFIDGDGVVFKQAPRLAGSILIRVTDMRRDPVVTVGQPILPDVGFRRMRELRTILNDRYDRAITEFILSDEAPTIRAHASSGWE
ncbi:MAG: hypothetical protein HY460_02125, partial [Parcubacteria group bacterium]|nr:hypothetical protein [Parcubacteria group bacterium]